MSDSIDLTGKLLIAMPAMDDPRFEHSVVFICAHSGDGAMGLIVNKPSDDLTLAGLLKHLGMTTSKQVPKHLVHYGGPVDHGRGFVLHTRDYFTDHSSLAVTDQIAMTATLDILEDIALGVGPKSTLMAMGYAGWGAGQLESEIVANGWLTSDASADLIFGAQAVSKWTEALKRMGVDPLLLSSEAGNA